MKFMKKMMESMMPVMLKGISSKEKEDMMLQMMPKMMEDIDLSEMMPKMMTTMLPVLLPKMMEVMDKDKMIEKMSTIMPNVCEVIDKRALAEKKDNMISKLLEQDTFKEKMPKCFAKGMPVMVRGCFEHFLPELPKEERIEFMSSLLSMMIEYGTSDFNEEDKKSLIKSIG